MKKTIMTALTGTAAAVCAALIGRGRSPALTVLAVLTILLLTAVAVMALELKRSMRETLYAYRNITLVGGILFAGVFAAVNAAGFIRLAPRLASDGGTAVGEVMDGLIRFPRLFSWSAVSVITLVVLLLGVSNIALIRHEGFCLHNALSLVLGGFYLGGTAAVALISHILETHRLFTETGRLGTAIGTAAALFFSLMLCYFECVFAGAALMGWRAARTKPSPDRDYIIILGCSIDRRGGLLPLLKGRVNRAIRFAWDQEIATGKPVKYVPSGGQGPNEIMSEGSAMEFYLLTRGAEDSEVMPEKKSANTWENLVFSKKLIDAEKPGAKVAFATTNYHVLRSGILARRAGLDAEGVAADTKWYFWPNGFVREFFAILSMNRRPHLIFAACALLVSIAAGILVG